MADPTHSVAPDTPADEAPATTLDGRQMATLLVSVFIIAICGLVYELIVGTLSSYLQGSSVKHFSITIGLFLSSMGVGAWLSRWIVKDELFWFVLVEIAVGIVGGSCGLLLFGAFALTPFFYPAMVLVILLIGAGIGLEVPLLTRLANGYSGLKDALANVFAFDYLGALIGSFLFPIVLLPRLGILRSSFVVGLVNLLVAVMILWTFRQTLSGWRTLSAITAVGILGLTAGLLGSDQLGSSLENRLYRDPIVFAAQTPYQRIVMTARGEDIRLFIDGNLQFSLRDEYRYHEALVHPAMTLAGQRDHVLVLGGGDGLALREILKYPDVVGVTVVDIDPAMTELARTHITMRRANADSLMDPRVTVVNADAFTFLQEGSQLYNVIIADLPDPNNESLSKFYSRSAYRLMRRRLAGDGVLVTQATSPFFARQAFWSIAATAEAEGLAILPYHVYVPSFGDWGFVMAAEQPLDASAYTPRVDLRYMTPQTFAIAQYFDSDVDGRVATGVSTLNDPAVLRYYQEAWRAWY